MTVTSPQKYLVVDYETRSEIDLREVGAFEYSMHPSTEILCVGWKFGTRDELKKAPASVFSPKLGKVDKQFLNLLFSPNVKLIAHNAFFETVITLNVLYDLVQEPILAPTTHRWICTASMARALALPGSLAGACSALGLAHQKDAEGRRLMLKMCKPRKPTKKDSNKWVESEKDILRLMQYCLTDVDAEADLFLTLPELIPNERKIWELDQKINMRGFYVDRPLVKKALKLIEEETKHLNQETDSMTFSGLVSATQRDGVLEWLKSEGVMLPNLQAKTVRDAIESGAVDGEAKRMLEIRQAISKTSTAKYNAFEMRSRSDSRLRDILVYHTASTGRWGGAGVQPQNFPRGSIKNTLQAAEILRESDLEWIRTIYGDPMTVFSSCLRNMIQASPGKIFFGGDYNAIEARVLFWVAKHEEGLKGFRENKKNYEIMASKIFSKDISKISPTERFVGKESFLGCGYMMGAPKFKKSCLTKGNIDIPIEVAELAVGTYRKEHWPVVQLWRKLEMAAVAAIQNPGTKYTINRTQWWMADNFLWCKLPSGRKLAFYGPELLPITMKWGEKKLQVHHWGVDSYTKKWAFGPTYGGKLTENVVSGIARDIMAEAMLRLEDFGFEIVLSVHDEILTEGKETETLEPAFENLMSELPKWAEGCPVKVAAWSGERYFKQ